MDGLLHIVTMFGRSRITLGTFGVATLVTFHQSSDRFKQLVFGLTFTTGGLLREGYYCAYFQGP